MLKRRKGENWKGEGEILGRKDLREKRKEKRGRGRGSEKERAKEREREREGEGGEKKEIGVDPTTVDVRGLNLTFCLWLSLINYLR